MEDAARMQGGQPGGPNVRIRPSTIPRVRGLPFLGSHIETPSVATFRFARGFDYLPNQFVNLKLPGVQDPWGPMRRFSLSSSPTEDHMSITTKLTGSPFKEALLALRPGDEAQVMGPLGHFVLDPERPAVMIAGGIGIAPFRGMVRYAFDRGLETPVVLLYSNRTPEDITFKGELDGLARELPTLRVIHTITRPNDARVPWGGRVGRIDAGLIQGATQGLIGPLYYICGLPEMVEDMALILYRGLGIPAQDIRVERFMGY